MTDKLIAAHTPNGGYTYYPPFINASRGGEYDNDVVLMLRGNEGKDGSCGDVVEATFSKADFALFLQQAAKFL